MVNELHSKRKHLIIRLILVVGLFLTTFQGTTWAEEAEDLTNPVVTGRVLQPDGNVFIPGEESHSYVHLRYPNGEDICGSGVNNDGSFLLGGDIPTGNYLLTADANGSDNPYANSIPLTVDVAAGQTLTQDIILTDPVITGRVLKPDGSVFTPGDDSHIDVRLTTANGEYICSSGVQNNGSFKLGGDIPSGDYLLMANANGINNPFASAIPLAVQVTAGQKLTQDISLTVPIITGRVLNPDGSVFISGPDCNAYVHLRNLNGDDILGGGVQNNGWFKLGGDIPAGDYLLTADANGSDNPYANAIPLTVHVTAGQTMTQDISLTTPVIKGWVLKPDGSVFIPGPESGVHVRLIRPDNSGEELVGRGIYDDGSFKLGGNIPTGDYILRAESNGSNNPYASAAGVAVHITAGQTLTQNISLTNPIITGRVLKPDGSVFIPGEESHSYVHLRYPNGEDICGSGVNNDGSFKMGGDIPTGNYLLTADANGNDNPYANSIQFSVNVTAGQTLTQDISLTTPVIKGWVLKPDGSVFISGPDCHAYVHLRNLNGDDILGGGVQNNGWFKLGGDIPSGNYLLAADANGSDNPYANSISLSVHVTAGQTLTQDISLTVPLITGRVLNPDGSVFISGPDCKAYVHLLKLNGDYICGGGVENNGWFKLGGNIPPGDYLLTADANGSGNPYANAIPLTVHVTAGQTLTRDISLTNPVVKGRVLTPQGSVFIPGQNSNAAVLIQNDNGDIICGVRADNDGKYKLGGIPAGDYWLMARADGYDNPYEDSIQMPIHITEGQVLLLDILLTESEYMESTGTVVFLNLEGGFYGIMGDDGQKYMPINQQGDIQAGDRVSFKGKEVKGGVGFQMWGKAIRILEIEVIGHINPLQRKNTDRPAIPSPVIRPLPQIRPEIKPSPVIELSPVIEPSPVEKPSPVVKPSPVIPVEPIRVSPDKPRRS